MANVNLNDSKNLLGVDKDAVVNTYIAREAITAGEWVDFNAAASADNTGIREVVQGNGTALCAGVALETVSSGDLVRVCVGGGVFGTRDSTGVLVTGVLTDGGVSIGEALMPAAAGACDTYAAASVLPIIGVALETDTGTITQVYVFRNVV